MALTDKLTAVADSIRAKTGKNDLLTLDEMPNEIGSISSLADMPEDAFMITGDCQYAFYGNSLNNIIKTLGSKIKTKDISFGYQMFYKANELEYIPFELNFNLERVINLNQLLSNCAKLKAIPKINAKVGDLKQTFYGCNAITELPSDMHEWFDWSGLENAQSYSMEGLVGACARLRKLPINLYERAQTTTVYQYTYYYQMAYNCFALDEAVGLPIPYTKDMTGNMFYSSLSNTYRLKRFTFETSNGQPHIKNWKGQTIDFTLRCGYTEATSNKKNGILIGDNGITAEDEVTDDATYQALKNTPNWFTEKIEYCRYNHDSAVETINSLPDTSAYLATAGGTNTIKFKGAAGSKTDGGAINTLTAEEIAVATAKGWTVTLA